MRKHTDSAERFRESYSRRERAPFEPLESTPDALAARADKIAQKAEARRERRRRKRFEMYSPTKGANPMNAPIVLDASNIRRNMDCAKYDACLDYADKVKWNNFHCDDCDLRNTKPVVLTKLRKL